MERTKKSFNILTNDPSFTAWGWAVINKDGRVLKTGCIQTKPSNKKLRIRKGDDRVRRIGELAHALMDVINEFDVRYIVGELPHGSQNAQAAIMIGATAAIIQTISEVTQIGVEWYGESDSKKCLLGKQASTKQEMIDAIEKYYDVPWTGIKFRDEAVADAIAIYHVATTQSSTLKLMKSM